jgi:hypothetical protein
MLKMPRKKPTLNPDEPKLPVCTKVKILRPNMWASLAGVVEGYGVEAVHIPKMVGFHIVRINRFDGTGFQVGARYQELEVCPSIQ